MRRIRKAIRRADSRNVYVMRSSLLSSIEAALAEQTIADAVSGEGGRLRTMWMC